MPTALYYLVLFIAHLITNLELLLFYTGHLVCRDLSNYLMSLPCMKGATFGRNEPLHSITERCGSREEVLLLLSAMGFVKLQICYFGNMALRSQLLFALIGSILVAVIPVLVASENR